MPLVLPTRYIIDCAVSNSGTLAIFDGRKYHFRMIDGIDQTEGALLFGSLRFLKHISGFHSGTRLVRRLRLVLVSALVGLAGGPMQMSHSHGEAEAIVGYPPFPKYAPAPTFSGMDWRWNIRARRFWSATSNNAMQPALGREHSIDREARAIVSKGFNTAIIESRYILGTEGDRTFWGCPPLPELIEHVKLLADIAHDNGLHAIGHLTVYIASSEYTEKHPDHSQVNVVTGKPAAGYKDGVGFEGQPTGTVCYNNPAFQQVYLNAVRRLVEATGLDGIMVDEVQFISSAADPWTCGCAPCRAEFTRDTGYRLPTGDEAESVLGDHSNEVFRNWYKWRIKQNGDFYLLLRDALTEAGGRDKVLFGCYSMPSMFGNDLDLESMARSWNLFFTESQPSAGEMYYFHSYLPVIADMKYVLAAADYRNTGYFTLYYISSEGESLFTFLLRLSQGSGGWRDGSLDEAPPFRWEERYDELRVNLEPLANIGVLYPSTTRAVQDPGVYMGYYGWCNALTEGQIPYNAVLERELELAERLARYRVLALPNASSLSDGQVERIERFVRRGGTIIASGQTSLYDETGKRRDDFGLADVFGLRYQGQISSPNTLRSEADGWLPPILGQQFANTTDHTSVEVTGEAVQVLCRGEDEAGNVTPSMTVNTYGKGKAIYLAFRPDIGSALSSIWGSPRPGREFVDPREPRYTQLLAQLARRESGDMPIVVKDVPKGVVVEGFTSHYGDQKGTSLTFLNCLGAAITHKTTQIPDDYSVHFPSVRARIPEGKKMTVEVRADDVNAAYLISPDFDEVVQLNHALKPNGYVEVEIPDLARFEMLYLNQGKRDLIRERNQTFTSEFPEVKSVTGR